MGNLNKVTLIGRLGSDPETKVTSTGKTLLNISLATSEHYTDKTGNKQEKTEWHRLVFWQKIADLVANYCKKGSQIYAEGTLQTREWKDSDGNDRYITEIVVRSVQFLDSKPKQVVSADINQTEEPWIEDDIPF